MSLDNDIYVRLQESSGFIESLHVSKWDQMGSDVWIGGMVISRGEQEFPFPSIPKNESLWFPFPNYGNGFFHSLPVPEFRECFFFIPFPFPNYGNGFFFIPFPFPNCGNGFFHSLPVPELWEWTFFIPFPFPNLPFSQMGILTGIEILWEIPVFQYF